MGLIFYPAVTVTGTLMPRPLPLSNVRMSGSTGDQPGQLTADLDLRQVVDGEDDWDTQLAECREVIDLLTPGAVSIVPIREDIWMGAGQPTTDACMGEWWVTMVERQHDDPVLHITGQELTAFPQRSPVVKTRRYRKNDPVAMARAIIDEAFTDGGIAHSLVNASSNLTTDVDIREGAIYASDAVRSMSGEDDFEWYINTKLDSNGRSINRTITFGVPELSFDKTSIVLEASTPFVHGVQPVTALDWATTTSIDASVEFIRLWGAGAGAGQVHYQINYSPATNVPRMGAVVQASDVLTTEALKTEARRIHQSMRKTDDTFQVRAPMSWLALGGPRVGHVYTWVSDPSLSMPDGEQGKVRVIAWEWQQPKPGEIETATLTVRRVP